MSAGLIGEIGGAEADRLVFIFDTALRVRRFLLSVEKADSAETPLGAEIEPVPNAAADGKKVSGLQFNDYDRASRGMDIANSTACYDQASLFLVVPMLLTALPEYVVDPRSLRSEIDDVVGNEVVRVFVILKLAPVGVQYLRRTCVGRKRLRVGPTMVFDADAREEYLDLSGHDERSAELRHLDDSHIPNPNGGRCELANK